MPLASLGGILASATSGMRAAQMGLDVVSRNVANAATEGYTRKQLPLENRIIGLQGAGVITREIERTVDKNLQKEIRLGTSAEASARAREELLGRLELAFGTPGDDTSISAQLGGLGNAFRTLVSQPDSSTQQQTVLARARAFARSSNDLSTIVQNLRLDAESSIDATVGAVNRSLKQIEALNSMITQARGLGQSTADLEDDRDLALSELAKSIDIRSFERPSGEIWILTSSGRQLLDGKPATLSFNPVSAMNASMIYGSGLSGVELDGVDISTELTGGKLHGLLQSRDVTLSDAQKQLDELSARVAQNFALSGLDLFDYGSIETIVTGRTAAASASAGATSFTVSSAAGVTVGMNLRFGNHPLTYEVTAVAGTTITIAPATGSGTGLEIDVPAGTSMVFADQPGTGSVGFSNSIGVNAAVEAEPWRLRDGTVVATMNTLAQDNTIPRLIVQTFERVLPFTASLGLGEAMTITSFAGAVISSQSTARATFRAELEARSSLNEQLTNRFESDSGVNLDQELALMIEIQTSYSAAAKIVQATQQMFDDLIGAMR